MDYRWWYSNQHNTREQIKRVLEGHVPFKTHEGNIWSIRYPNKPVFIAHMDTVSACNESNKLILKRGRVKRKDSPLGADDRAGVNLIMNYFKKVNFIFTRDEEIGSLGAKELALHKPFLQDLKIVSCIVELDCTGHKKIRGAVHGYCNNDLVDAVKKVIPDVTDTHGSYSDLDAFTSFKAGVNLSVGYYKQHTKAEYLVLKEYNYVDSIMLQLDKELRGDYTIVKKKVYSYPSYTPYVHQKNKTVIDYYNPVKNKQKLLETIDETVCDNCDAVAQDLTFVDTLEMWLCEECLIDLYLDMMLLKEKGGLLNIEDDREIYLF